MLAVQANLMRSPRKGSHFHHGALAVAGELPQQSRRVLRVLRTGHRNLPDAILGALAAEWGAHLKPGFSVSDDLLSPGGGLRGGEVASHPCQIALVALPASNLLGHLGSALGIHREDHEPRREAVEAVAQVYLGVQPLLQHHFQRVHVIAAASVNGKRSRLAHAGQ
eukprot:scaffold1282_cov251-Pinguiococcus_pyrenoidosus.AAC.52